VEELVARVVVLVEGESDRAAVDALAGRRGLDLHSAGVAVMSMGGITNVGRYLRDVDRPVVGLYDAGEEAYVRRALAADGHDGSLEDAGFYMCVADLEDELIRAVGPEGVERIVAAQGELQSLRTLQKQAPHRGRSLDAQLHRFIGAGAGRKLRYARLMAEALDPGRVPVPLDRALRHALRLAGR
jgi:hypothetical protein